MYEPTPKLGKKTSNSLLYVIILVPCISQEILLFLDSGLNIWECLQLLENLPLIAEGTKVMVSYALESTCFELNTLMEYYTSSPDPEIFARLKAAGLVCSMAVVQCGFFEPNILEWARKLKGQYTHPFIIGMNSLDFADVINTNVFLHILFKI
jgi:hypothetical protein